MTNHFTFFASYYDAVEFLDNDIKAEFFDVLFKYALRDEMPENMSPVVQAIFTMAKPNLDTSKARREAGARGGKQKQNNEEANDKQTGSKPEAKPKQTPSDKEKDKDKDKDKEDKKKKQPSAHSLEFSKSFYANLSQNGGKKTYTSKEIQQGAETIDKLVRIDKYSLSDEIGPALAWGLQDEFWSGQIRSLAQLRKKSKSNGETKFSNVFAQFSSRRNKKAQFEIKPRTVSDANAIRKEEMCGRLLEGVGGLFDENEQLRINR